MKTTGETSLKYINTKSEPTEAEFISVLLSSREGPSKEMDRGTGREVEERGPKGGKY